MRNKNQRVALEMRIMRYQLLARRVTDEEFVKQSQQKIAELERKLRETDEYIHRWAALRLPIQGNVCPRTTKSIGRTDEMILKQTAANLSRGLVRGSET